MPELGKRPPEGALRDAIHMAVYPAVAGCTLRPGVPVVLLPPTGRAYTAAHVGSPTMPHGIVDPFLEAQVGEGERFWLCLFPGTSQNIRHIWSAGYIADEAPPKAPKTADVKVTGLLSSLLETPDNTTIAALADWLEERGEVAAAGNLRDLDVESFGGGERCGC